MKTKYHIFKVADYKGGELFTDINLDVNEFYKTIIDHLSIEILDEDDNFLYKDKITLYNNIIKILNDPEQVSIYAGNGSYVAKWYKSEGFILEEIEKESILKDLTEYIWNQYI